MTRVAANAWPADRVERWPVARLLPAARNARTHTPAQVDQIAASIREWGWTTPALIEPNGTLIAGHGRVLAAQKLGLESIPVMVAEGWTAAQVAAYRLADNQLALNAGWNDDLLRIELGDLAAMDFDLALTGFDADDLERLLSTVETTGRDSDGDDDKDDIPPVPAIPISRPGDVWIIGPHRLMCGDATDRQAVGRLMAGDQAKLCFTSPPYGNQRHYTTGGVGDWFALMRGVFAHLPMADAGQVLVNLGLIHDKGEYSIYWNEWIEWMRAQGWRRFGWYVWDQGPGLPGDWNGRLAPAHEFVFHFNRKARKPNKIEDKKPENIGPPSGTGLRDQDGTIRRINSPDAYLNERKIPDSVIRIMRHKARQDYESAHPAMFPIALPEFVIQVYSDAGDVVYEPFNGSGTMLIAAQRTGRHGRAMDIAPEYVDVAVLRMQQHFPELPAILETTGQSFAERAAEVADE